MSALINSLDIGAQDRSVIATRHLCEALQLGVLKPKDLKHLSVALAEASTQEFSHNAAFAERVRALYHELTMTKTPTTGGRQVTKRASSSTLTPENYVDPKLFGPDKPLDPYLLQYAYGDRQLRAALERYPASELKKAAAIVEQRNFGTKPTSRNQKAALIEYIVSHLIP